MHARVVPVVLAAGASRRMGRDKALLPLGDRSALQVVVATARAAGAAPAIVVVAAGTPVEAHARSQATVIVNPDPTRGQLSSLQVGLAALPAGTGAFLVWPVDHPLATAADVRAIVDAFVATAAPIVVPSHARRRGHPMLVSAALAPEFLALPPTETARSIVARYADAVAYADASADVLADMDTPDDYERCRSRFLAREGQR